MLARTQKAIYKLPFSIFPQRRHVYTGFPRTNALRQSNTAPPTSVHPLFRNQFDHADHPCLWEEDSRRQLKTTDVNPVLDPTQLSEFSNQPHQIVGIKSSQPRYVHYNYVYEPPFVPTPDLSRGELAAGASVTRTSVWATPDEPAIQSVGRFTPDHFRPIGYAENIPNPTIANPYHDFGESRLPSWHADRRPFTYLMSATTAFVAASVVRAMLIETVAMVMPKRETLASDYIEVELGAIAPGESAMVRWKGRPVMVSHRTPEQIRSAKALDAKYRDMRDPEYDADRTFKEEWMVCIAVCTHLGCIPTSGGNYDGYFCPCHGSHYDASGRIWQGPAGQNLAIPPHRYLTDDVVLIG